MTFLCYQPRDPIWKYAPNLERQECLRDLRGPALSSDTSELSISVEVFRFRFTFGLRAWRFFLFHKLFFALFHESPVETGEHTPTR